MSLNLSMPVLVVNDHPTMASIVSNVLKQIGFEHVEGARNAAAALKKLHCKNYGLVISDDTMQSTSAGDLLREIRADRRISATPFLLLTANESNCNIAEPCAKIAKPFNAQMLQRTITTVLTD
jgi:two-component system chemotaxis response regulator CheY